MASRVILSAEHSRRRFLSWDHCFRSAAVSRGTRPEGRGWSPCAPTRNHCTGSRRAFWTQCVTEGLVDLWALRGIATVRGEGECFAVRSPVELRCARGSVPADVVPIPLPTPLTALTTPLRGPALRECKCVPPWDVGVETRPSDRFDSGFDRRGPLKI